MFKIIQFKIILLISLLITTVLMAQQTSDGRILLIPPSAKLNAMGGVGVALSIPDPFLQYINPAQLGMVSRMTNFGLHFYPSGLQLSATPRPVFKSSAVSLGYQSRESARGSGMSFGIGYINSDLDLGESVAAQPGTGQQTRWVGNETYYSISAGLGFDYFILINIGLTYKWITVNPGLIVMPDDQLVQARDNLGALDYGLLLVVPLHRLVLKPGRSLDPFIDFSVGFSRANLGGEIKYNDFIAARPLPRTARLGYALSAGLNIEVKKRKINAITGYWSVDADDILVNDYGSSFSYQGFFGDINIGRNIIRATGDDKVIARVGYGLEIFDTFFLAAGYYAGQDYDRTNTYGYGIRTKGIFSLLGKRYTKNAFSFILDNMDIQYYYSKYAIIPGQDIRYHGIIVNFSGI